MANVGTEVEGHMVDYECEQLNADGLSRTELITGPMKSIQVIVGILSH